MKPGKFTLSLDVPVHGPHTHSARAETPPSRTRWAIPFLQNFFGATVQKDITVSSPIIRPHGAVAADRGPAQRLHGSRWPVQHRERSVRDDSRRRRPAHPAHACHRHGQFRSRGQPHAGTSSTAGKPIRRNPPSRAAKPPARARRRFEQPVIASKPGAQTLPGLAFSYFNPTTKHYETARSAPLSVTISPSLADSSHERPARHRTSSPEAEQDTQHAPPAVGPASRITCRRGWRYRQQRWCRRTRSLAFLAIPVVARRSPSSAPGSRSDAPPVPACAYAVSPIQRPWIACCKRCKPPLATKIQRSFFNIAREALAQSLAAFAGRCSARRQSPSKKSTRA